MVKAIIVSAALAAASIASVAQAASLKQNPLFGCEGMNSGLLTLGADADENLGFVAGHTEKSLITGKKSNAVLDSKRPSGKPISPQYFEFLNCTQSLTDEGYELSVPKNMIDLETEIGADFTYAWGVIVPEDEEDRDSYYSPNVLSIRSKADSKGRLDAVRLLETKVSDTPIEARTFVSAYDEQSGLSYLEFYPFVGSGNSTKSGFFYTAGNKYGSIDVSTNHTAHANSTFLVLGDD
ncbi:hypothetical protein BCV69DRAFT_176460 [Microstroma glucosiphilum]|uniref:Uncharacterized protein n=1 Tax=Pseudomicrostroma glucosiphilum TaxID=1684307 RepID=A0A316U8P6_9BASI|nr:hypothetical protein BCV69DRAFT_176460 [Pseudomicrostroma glucosiphilum]PWN21630.1 hypothetical protein BCV69DRAFT_176460 [Pseudomicrostroma glucosiphilum]